MQVFEIKQADKREWEKEWMDWTGLGIRVSLEFEGRFKLCNTCRRLPFEPWFKTTSLMFETKFIERNSTCHTTATKQNHHPSTLRTSGNVPVHPAI